MVSAALKVGSALFLFIFISSISNANEIARYGAQVVRVYDGDTVFVNIQQWPSELNPVAIRLFGVDTPESTKRLAKCKDEQLKGLEAKAFAKSIMPAGLKITVIYTNRDKYGGRIGGKIILPDGQDF